MLKLNFNTPVPYLQRNKLIHALQNLGFAFEYVYQNGTYGLIKFSGRLPTTGGKSCVDIIFSDEKTKEDFKQVTVDYVEMYFLTERKRDYENRIRN